jgi:enterochelin esterase family protein
VRLIVALFSALAALAAAVPPSPKIELLRNSLRERQSATVEVFWEEVATGGGTPLIECPASLAPDCLVTFLWRGDAGTGNVLVRSEAMPGAPAEHLFDHLPGTNVWYRTYRFQRDVRFMYMLSINDPLTPWEVEGPERKKRYAGVRTDPLNQRSPGYVSLPGAPTERWIEDRAGVIHGKITDHQLPSAAFSARRPVGVYQTPGFLPGDGATPVLILFDGNEVRELGKTPIILDNLFAEGRIPPMLAVFLAQPHESRESDLSCSQSTNRFLVQELLPRLRREYKIRTGPERTIASGASLGSLAAAYAALKHPEEIGRVLSQSGSFWWGKTDAEPEWLTAEFASTPRVKVKFYVDVGLMETNGGAISQLETNRHFAAVLRSKGNEVVYHEFNGTHAYHCWRASFADALMALLKD